MCYLSFSYSSLHRLLFEPTNIYASVPSLALEQKPSSLLSSTLTKLLTSLALRSLLYLLLAPGHLSNQHRFLNRLGLRHRVNDTARKSLISTGREPPVCTGFPTGTAPPVPSARALSTGQLTVGERHISAGHRTA